MLATARTIALGLLTLAVVSAAAVHAADDKDLSIEGFWMGVQEDEAWSFIFEFAEDAAGTYTGSIHVYQGEKKVQEVPIDEIDLKDDEIRLHMKLNDVRYQGKVNVEKHAIDGQFKYADGSSRAMILNWTDPTALPGLSARQTEAGDQYEYAYTVPEQIEDNWETGDLEDHNIDPAIISEMVTRIVAGDFGFLHSLLIVRDGELVLEEYFYNHDRESPHRLASTTKSVSSLLIGIAVDKGFIEGVDQPIMSFFPGYESSAASGWDKIRLVHILTMSAGLGWDKQDLDGFYGCKDRFGTIFKQPPTGTPGEKFEYVSPNVDLLAGVIKHATGMHADRFAEKYLFEPLGIEAYEWDYGKWQGHPLMDGSLAFRSRDMAKIGQMVLDGGSWNGKQVVSEQWIAEATAAHADPEGPEDYGYLWWRTSAPFEDRTVEGIFASGWGSQFIFILPEYDLVVVTTGGNDDNDMNFAPVRLFPEYILRAMK
jgi:CubicO group peptidase (beta-lactamase class C family)